MKRAYLRKVKPVSNTLCSADDTAGQPEQELKGVRRKARTSAAMVGLALSMGATGFLLPRQNDGASAAEPKGAEAAVSSASEATVLSPSVEVAPITTAAPQGMQLLEYTVRPGETLQQIAEKYQITLAALVKANNLTPTSALKAGQLIKVPGSNFKTALAESAESNVISKAERDQSLERLRLQRDKLRNRLTELRSEQNSNRAQTENQATTPTLIAELPGAASQSTSAQNDSVVLSLNPSEAADNNSIAQAPSERVSASEQLIATSSLPDPDWIRANQTLLNQPAVPSPVAPLSVAPSSPDTVALRSTGLPIPQATPLADPVSIDQNLSNPVSSSEFVAYRISPGDTIAEIARAHNISQSELIAANRISDPNVIFVGQVLQVPSAIEAATSAPKSVSINPISTSTVEPTAPTIASIQGIGSVQTSEVVTVPTVPTSSVAEQPTTTILPQRVAVAPSTFVPTVPEVAPSPQSSTEATPSVPAIGGTNPYVQNLLSEVRTLRQQYNQNGQKAAASEPAAVQVSAVTPIAQPAATSSVSTTAAPGAVAVNPEFQRRRSDSVQSSRPSTNTEAQSNLVAVAPIGSENYEPLLQPVTGRMVSPDLPPLPGADNFLPSSRGIFNGYIWPTKGLLTSGYGWRWGRMHRGIDIAADVGTPVYAAADGVVEYAGWNSGGYGNMIDIRHADGSVTRYAHLNRILIQSGQNLKQGQQIAEMGSTGYSTGPHLHFEVHLAQGTVNPISYLPTNR